VVEVAALRRDLTAGPSTRDVAQPRVAFQPSRGAVAGGPHVEHRVAHRVGEQPPPRRVVAERKLTDVVGADGAIAVEMPRAIVDAGKHADRDGDVDADVGTDGPDGIAWSAIVELPGEEPVDQCIGAPSSQAALVVGVVAQCRSGIAVDAAEACLRDLGGQIRRQPRHAVLVRSK
jgi:hypothetical protein